ncbi:MAG: DUF4428 domain-containing protein [Ruminococcaceae bacterium]|nr:DUF4428 domain-containing protein [Oscillospiraceae bacterium]
MAKHNCAICGAEVGLLAQQKLADGNFICRKVCAKKCLKHFDLIPATLDDVKAHIEQIEYGTKVWEQIFVPLQKTKNKEEKLRGFGQYDALVVSPSTGLVAITQDDYKFFIFGKTTRAVVFRLADLYRYDYETEVSKDSEGKEVTKHFAHLTFNNTVGLFDFRMPCSDKLDFESMEKYLNNCFGIQKTLKNSINNAKRQMDAIKAVAGAVKEAATGGNNLEEKGSAAIDAVNANIYGDRTEWIKKADAALATVK